MSNEISAAKGIGSRIGKSTGSIPTIKFKKAGDKDKEPSGSKKPAGQKKTGRKEVFEGTVYYPTPINTNNDDIIDAEVIEPKAIAAPRKALGGGQRWEEFKTYVEANKAGKLSPPTKLD